MAAFMQRRCLSGAVAQSPVQRSVVQRAPLHVCASYKNKENVDLSKVANYARSESDVGSTEVQVARLNARVDQITGHLKENRKDYSAQRGLQILLNQRRKLLQYLYKRNRAGYDKITSELGIRSQVGKNSGDTMQQKGQKKGQQKQAKKQTAAAPAASA